MLYHTSHAHNLGPIIRVLARGHLTLCKHFMLLIILSEALSCALVQPRARHKRHPVPD
jgi:hypothetical protein